MELKTNVNGLDLGGVPAVPTAFLAVRLPFPAELRAFLSGAAPSVRRRPTVHDDPGIKGLYLAAYRFCSSLSAHLAC